MGKLVAFDDAARRALRRGVEQLAGAVRVTLGPRGRNVVIERAHGAPTISNDGLGIAREIELEDPFENLGARLLREAAVRTGEVAGDGTTTSTVLARALVGEGLRAVAAGQPPMRVRRGIERGVAAVVEALRAGARAVSGPGDLRRIATVSARSDESVGAIVAEAFERVGAQGVVNVEEGRGIETTLDVVEGLRFESGYLSPYFVTDPESMAVVLDGPLVLVTELKLAAARDVVPVLERAAALGRPLLVVADEVEDDALATCVVNRLRGTVSSVVVKAPGVGDHRRELLEDLAVATGARRFARDSGATLERIADADLGRARRVRVERDATTVIEGAGRAEAVRAHLAGIDRLVAADPRGVDADRLRQRAARLRGGVARIRVGGMTELDLRERMSRVEDALAATRSALEEGVVTGGGVALLRAASALDAVAPRDDGEAAGLAIVRRALEEPLRQIAANAGADGNVAVAKVREGSGSYGFDALAADYGDLDARGVLDATRVVRCALENAASIATMVLTTDALVVDDPASSAGEPPEGS